LQRNVLCVLWGLRVRQNPGAVKRQWFGYGANGARFRGRCSPVEKNLYGIRRQQYIVVARAQDFGNGHIF